MIQLGSGGIGSDPMGKTKALTRLKGADNYPIWWLRFVPMARARGFDRILKYREKYIDEIRADAAAMHLKNMTLDKKDDVGRNGGETFDSPEVEHHRSVSEVATSSDMSGAGSDSDASSGLKSVGISATSSRGSSRGSGKKKRTIETKVNRKIRKLNDFIILCVSDKIAMRLERKAKGNGLEALKVIEREYASKEVDRASDLKSEMKDLDPAKFKKLGDYMDAVLQIQEQLEVIGWPVEESMVKHL